MRQHQVYTHPVIQQISDFYGTLLTHRDHYPNIEQHLFAIAKRMHDGVLAKNEAVYVEIANYHQAHLGESIDSLQKLQFTFQDCLTTVAHQYGFRSWEALVAKTQAPYDINFEHAIDYLLDGKLEELSHLIMSHPGLITQPSQYGHQATLLHYVASNGVEIWRQRVPSNIAMMTNFLLQNGADPNAKMHVYGGHYDTYALLISSAHPYEAGVIHELKSLLI